jgi:hypothetical protein
MCCLYGDRGGYHWDDPQGCCFGDFHGYPCLEQHAEGLDIYARGGRFNPAPGIEWITFRAHGGAYTAQWLLDALLMNIARKIEKYTKPHNNQKLKSQKLDEFYLLTYYDEAVLPTRRILYRTSALGKLA